ncbi:MAG TPA: VWA domain-containing protein [Actinomycetota bacterium]|nr:VWA domain-containing protein [Actinomycetota bacterium]
MVQESSLEQRVEIANPQHPHCATVLVVDTSSSMAGDKIRQLNDGIRIFKDDVSGDELARKRVDLAVVSFGGSVSVEHDFSSIEDFEPPQMNADGGTPMGEALLRAIEMVRSRKQSYKDEGTDYFRPWIFLITDGEPTDMGPGDEKWNRVVDAIHAGEDGREFLFFAVGVEPADMNTLAMIAPAERPPLGLRPGRFREMFTWLSKSQQRVSVSRVGEQVPLDDPTGPSGWAEIATT